MIVFFIIITALLLLVLAIREFQHLDAIHKERCNHAETIGRLRYYLEQNANKLIK